MEGERLLCPKTHYLQQACARKTDPKFFGEEAILLTQHESFSVVVLRSKSLTDALDTSITYTETNLIEKCCPATTFPAPSLLRLLTTLHRFQRYQLPAWAHTQPEPTLTGTPKTTATTASPAKENTSSPTSEMKISVSAEKAPAGGCEGAADSEIGGKKARVAVDLGRDSPPPVLEALVSGAGIWSGSLDRRDGRNKTSNSGSKAANSAADPASRAGNAVGPVCSSESGAEDSDPGEALGDEVVPRFAPSLLSSPLSSPTSLGRQEEEEPRGQQRTQEQYPADASGSPCAANSDPAATVNGPATTTTPAAAASRQGRESCTSTDDGAGGALAARRVGWGTRRETAAAVAGGTKRGVLGAVRSRWGRRGVQEEVRRCVTLGEVAFC